MESLQGVVWGPRSFRLPSLFSLVLQERGVGRLGARQGTDGDRRAGGSTGQEERGSGNQGVRGSGIRTPEGEAVKQRRGTVWKAGGD